MDRIIELIFLILYGLSYVEPHLKKIRKRIERFLKPFYKAILVAINNAIRRFSRSFMSYDGPLIIIISAALLLDSILSIAGIGYVYDVYGKTIRIAMICLFYQAFMKKRFMMITSSTFIIVMFIIISNLYHIVRSNSNYFEYVLLYAIVILYSIWYVSEEQMRWICMIYGIGGMAILAAAKFTDFFRGWESSSISNLAFFSYTVSVVGCVNITQRKHKIFFIIYSCIYFVWLEVFNARSSILCSLILMLCILKVIPLKKILTEKTILIILLTPLIIAVFIVIIHNMPFTDDLNLWSIRHFKKPIFNGRDTLWEKALIVWRKHCILGDGNPYTAWHNSAVTCLAETGTLGYVAWIYVIRKWCLKAYRAIDDNITFGALSSFMIVWLHQSLEQGLFGVRGSPVVMFMLGIMLARVNTLNRGEIIDESNKT